MTPAVTVAPAEETLAESREAAEAAEAPARLPDAPVALPDAPTEPGVSPAAALSPAAGTSGTRVSRT